MIYYQGYSVSFQEVPDETSLVIEVADCPHHCVGCHSPYLRKPEGKDLISGIDKLIAEYSDAITCVCFMGDGRDVFFINQLALLVRSLRYKAAVYSGYEDALEKYGLCFDYVKAGEYKQKLGGLSSSKTNQKMYYINHKQKDLYPIAEDITYKFWKTSDYGGTF